MGKWTKMERANRVEGVVDIPPSVIRLLKYRKVHASCCEKFAQKISILTEIGKKAWLFAKLQPGRARKRINAT